MWQYYHARKSSEETPLEYLYRLNVAGMRARLKIKDGDVKARIEHVEHFIETLDDPDLADQLTLLRLADAIQLEDVLRARERAKSRQKHSTVSSKYRPKSYAPSSPTFPTCAERAIQIADARSDPEDSRSEGELPGESRGYWKHHVPDKHFKQAKANSKINNVRVVALLDTGSEVSIIDATFVRKVGFCIDTSQSQECLGIGEKLYIATGRTRIKHTLAGSLVYLYDVWVGDDLPPDYQVIIGMDFMVPAGIRLDLGDGSMCLPDEIRVNLRGRRRIFSDKVRPVYVGEHLTLEVAEAMELALQIRGSDKEKLWLTRGERWVPTIVKCPGKLRYLHVTNLGDEALILQRDMKIGLWLAGDRVPRQPGFVSVGPRRYAEWQTLAWEATTDAAIAAPPALPAPGPVSAVDRVEYAMPRRIVMRPKRFGDAPPEEEPRGGRGCRRIAP
ncbi:hypothetical protein PR003_g24436 [Phytophthora rubi]|uniref:Peptidase A2 domain-containing protein n=1 Tax=Phytophthora rubi TaxID=129364 RepID=A0A6A4CT39_9STRA|nr:hypothetical protein PR003_g24436 [Phytophthora rubi]